MKLSVVVSVYNEDQVIQQFHESLNAVLNSLTMDFEIIYVNDGSTDNSATIIEGFAESNHKIKNICFSRNFGHEAAMIAGIDYATGDAVICMDSDLQHPPTVIPEMIHCFEKNKVEIISMVRTNNSHKSPSPLFYQLLNKISPYEITANASDFFLISAKVADILRNDYRERVRFLRGFIQIIGFKKMNLEFQVDERKGGKSKYSIRKLVSLSVTAVATLSKLPLKFGIYMGLASGLFSILLAVYSVVMKFIDQPVSGYTTIVVFLGLMFSIQFVILGILGEYIGFLFDEQKKRPIYIVEKTSNI